MNLFQFHSLIQIFLISIFCTLSFVTRFNSMSSAVGPLVIDNLITEQKLKEFSEFIIDSEGNMLSTDNVLDMHPILRQFFRTLNMARTLLNNMPAYRTGFSNILNALEGTSLSYIRQNRDYYLSLVISTNLIY